LSDYLFLKFKLLLIRVD